MAGLSGAYYGYDHQDLVAAHALASLLLPRSGLRSVAAERKASSEDRFADLELIGNIRRRVQVKAHTVDARPLRTADFVTQSISFQIDDVIRGIQGEPAAADEYRLFTSFEPPDAILSPFLATDQSTPSLFPALATQRFRLLLEKIWPAGDDAPVWSVLGNTGRSALADVCNRMIIEVGCPRSSGDLREPGPLEIALLAVLRDEVGIGAFPNDNRDLADAGAQLIYVARTARQKGLSLVEGDVVKALALRIDYGRISERFPVRTDRLVVRSEILA